MDLQVKLSFKLQLGFSICKLSNKIISFSQLSESKHTLYFTSIENIPALCKSTILYLCRNI